MEPSAFDELAFFRAIQKSRTRALLIGRRALVLLENDEHVDSWSPDRRRPSTADR